MDHPKVYGLGESPNATVPVRENTGDILVFLTNHLGLHAFTIATICKDRWQF